MAAKMFPRIITEGQVTARSRGEQSREAKWCLVFLAFTKRNRTKRVARGLFRLAGVVIVIILRRRIASILCLMRPRAMERQQSLGGCI
jgi:hypothetical protein